MQSSQDVNVLREMVRIAENRRTEELQTMERINQYNLALIAFAGSFLSFLLTANLPKLTTEIAGASLMITIVLALMAIRPRIVKGALVIEDDVALLKGDTMIDLKEYLLDTAALIDISASSLSVISAAKKNLTIFAAIFLATSLFITYILYVYA